MRKKSFLLMWAVQIAVLSTFFSCGEGEVGPDDTTVATPVFAPVPGTYQSPQTVSITTATPGATIHYTTAGDNPADTSTTYTGPISVPATTSIRAGAWKVGLSPSATAIAKYTITPSQDTVATPVFSPLPGSYETPQTVSISTATPGATIHYTADGIDPAETSTTYTAAISVSTTTTIKARAWKAGLIPSAVATGIFNIGAFAPCTDVGSDGTADNIILVGPAGTNCITDGTNDQVEIQAALDNATSGVTVKLVIGTYWVTAPAGRIYNPTPTITMSVDGVIFDGSGSTVKLTADTPHLVMLLDLSASHAVLKNTIFDGNKVSLSGGPDHWGWSDNDKLVGVSVTGDDNTISDISVNDVEGDGLVAGGSRSRFENISISDATHDGIPVWRLTDTTWNNVTFYINEQRRDGVPQNAGLRINGGSSSGNVFNNFSFKRKAGTGMSSIQAPLHYAIDNSNSPQSNNLFQYWNITEARAMSCVLLNDFGNGGTKTNLVFKNFVCNPKAADSYSWQAVQVTGKWESILFDGFTIFGGTNGGFGFSSSALGWSDNVTIKNSIVVETGNTGIAGGSITNSRAIYNDVWSHAVGYSGALSAGTGSISVDPLFASTTDFHLKSAAGRWNGTGWVTDPDTSPAINAGDPTDAFDKEPDPNGGRIDLGAYGNTTEASKGP